MTLRLITAPAVEPITIAEAMRKGRISSSSAEPAPSSFTVALASPAIAGNVDNGAHRYLATFVTASGETQSGTVSAAVTVADKTVNGKVELTAIPIGGALVTSRKLYRTAAAGSTYMLLATIANNTATTYTDNIADASLGVGAPSVNTTLDPDVADMIASARRIAERNIGRRLITQTWEQVYDGFPANEMKLGIMPVQSITSVKYYDTAGALQTLATDQYVLDADTLPGWLLPAYGTSWPATYGIAQSVIVRMAVGFGSSGADVPPEIRQWINTQVAVNFANPDGLYAGNATPLGYLDGLLDEFDIRSIA